MITESREFIKNVRKVDQGTIKIQCLGGHLYRLVFPDFTEVEVRGKSKAASAARAWFQRNVPDQSIGIGRIEWHT